jgi:hypothetical protein
MACKQGIASDCCVSEIDRERKGFPGFLFFLLFQNWIRCIPPHRPRLGRVTVRVARAPSILGCFWYWAPCGFGAPIPSPWGGCSCGEWGVKSLCGLLIGWRGFGGFGGRALLAFAAFQSGRGVFQDFEDGFGLTVAAICLLAEFGAVSLILHHQFVFRFPLFCESRAFSLDVRNSHSHPPRPQSPPFFLDWFSSCHCALIHGEQLGTTLLDWIISGVSISWLALIAVSFVALNISHHSAYRIFEQQRRAHTIPDTPPPASSRLL